MTTTNTCNGILGYTPVTLARDIERGEMGDGVRWESVHPNLCRDGHRYGVLRGPRIRGGRCAPQRTA